MKSPHERKSRIDFGRMFMVPLSAIVVLRNAFVIYHNFSTLPSLSALEAITQVNTILVTSFYVLMVAAYLWRSSARQSSSSFAVNVVAVVATFLPALLLIAGADVHREILLTLVGTAIATAGMGFSVYALHRLGRSFSIIPQSREMVASGPYKYLRHPLYAGEIMAMAGFLMAHLTVQTMAIFVVMVAMQAYRAMREERILASTFPGYEGYQSRTWRFVPGIF